MTFDERVSQVQRAVDIALLVRERSLVETGALEVAQHTFQEALRSLLPAPEVGCPSSVWVTLPPSEGSTEYVQEYRPSLETHAS